jgi:hypothetical protein
MTSRSLDGEFSAGDLGKAEYFCEDSALNRATALGPKYVERRSPD